jgi:hypothetical protein
MSMLRKGLLLWAALLLLPVIAAGQDPDPLLPDTIRVDSVATVPGTPAGVEVTCWNDEDLGGYSLGFHWTSPDITVDSVTYWDSRLSWYVNRYLTVLNADQFVLVGMADLSFNHPLEPGDGNIFTIWFGVPPGTPDQYVYIDSAFVPPAGTFTISPAAGGSVTPQFKKGTIKIGNPPPPPEIVLSQTSFTFNAEVGGGNPTSQVLNITNGGGQQLNWTATWSEAWLGVNPASGTAPSVVVITANITGLSPGTYKDTVTVDAVGATNTPQAFVVTLNLIVPPPTIELSPDTFYFQALQDSAAPVPQDMQINNVGLGTLNWTATETASWLDLSAYSGTAPSVVTLSINTTSLPPGLYTTQVEVSDPYATNDPQFAPVVYEVFSAFPVIEPIPNSIFAVGSATENPYDHLLLVSNNGGGVMDWSISYTQPWMTVDIDTGSAVQGDPGEVMLSFDGSSLGFGKHYDTLTITSGNATNSPILVPVTFWKSEAPQVLGVSTSSLSFSTVECGTYPPVAAKIFNVVPLESSPPLNWTLTYNADWMTVTPTGAPGLQTVTVTVSEDGLAPGLYEDTIVVTSDVSFNPYEIVVVQFTVLPSPPDPKLLVNADSLVFVFKWTLVGSADRELVCYVQGGGCTDWEVTSTVPWLTTIPSSGNTVGELTVRSDAIGLSLGRHEGELIFNSDNSPNTPFSVPTVLWVYTLGDANGDGLVNITDAVYITNYIFGGGPAPVPLPFVGDVDCSHRTNVSDVVYLVQWIFGGGPAPCGY